MKIEVAGHSGFCFGVKRAVESVENCIGETEKLYTYGQIIHNPQVVEDFQAKGVLVADGIEDVDENSTVVIRSHGVPPSVLEALEAKNVRVVNATCPHVLRIQQTAGEYYAKGYRIFIVGEEGHPEVIGINGWCDNTATVLDSVEKAEALEKTDAPCCVVAQTGTMLEKWNEVIGILETKCTTLEKFNTICNATSLRQREAEQLAKRVDVMIVIGGSNSFNTQKLYEICKMQCERTYAVERIKDLSAVHILPNETLGITAGASTPERLIKEVITVMEEIEKNEAQTNWLEEFEEQKRIRTGSFVEGEIISLNDNEMFLNIGYKSDALLPANQVTLEEGQTLTSVYQLGQKVSAEVVKLNDGEGNVLLSKKRVDVNSAWEKLEALLESGEEFSAKCTEAVKGGVVANVGGIRVFIPASQVAVGFAKDLNEYVGQDLRLKVIEIDRAKRKAVASQKVILQAEADAKKKAALDAIVEGQNVKGIVKRFTNFGAFVDLGGVDGMIHVTDMAWYRVHKPQDILAVGQEIECVVLAVDREKERISLGYKQLQSHPWDNIMEKYQIGSVVTGTVARVVSFGVFVALEPGVDGLVHISEVSDKWVKNAAEVLTPGQEVNALVLDIDTEQKRISLSIKALIQPEEEEAEEQAAEVAVEATEEAAE